MRHAQLSLRRRGFSLYWANNTRDLKLQDRFRLWYCRRWALKLISAALNSAASGSELCFRSLYLSSAPLRYEEMWRPSSTQSVCFMTSLCRCCRVTWGFEFQSDSDSIATSADTVRLHNFTAR